MYTPPLVYLIPPGPLFFFAGIFLFLSVTHGLSYLVLLCNSLLLLASTTSPTKHHEAT